MIPTSARFGRNNWSPRQDIRGTFSLRRMQDAVRPPFYTFPHSSSHSSGLARKLHSPRPAVSCGQHHTLRPADASSQAKKERQTGRQQSVRCSHNTIVFFPRALCLSVPPAIDLTVLQNILRESLGRSLWTETQHPVSDHRRSTRLSSHSQCLANLFNMHDDQSTF